MRDCSKLHCGILVERNHVYFSVLDRYSRIDSRVFVGVVT